MTHDNTKVRTATIAAAALSITVNSGAASKQQPPVLALAKLVAEATGCHIDTAKRHVRQALLQLRKPGYKQPQHGGLRVSGEASPVSKLTAAAVRSIRQRVAEGQPVATVAEEFGVSASTVYAIVQRRRWAHVA